MNIRWKVGLLIAALLVVLGLSEILVAKSVLMPSFTDLEHAEARVAMRRVQYALDRSFEQLLSAATSWGNWADTYRFVQDHNKSFLNENLTAIGMQQLDVNAIAILDARGGVVAAGALDSETGQAADLNLLRQLTADPQFPWRRNLLEGRSAHGLLQSDRGVVLLAAAPILDGFNRGPARGMVLMARILSAGQISQLAAQAQVKLALLPPVAADGRGQIVESVSNTAVYQTFPDIYGRPLMTLRLDVPREITGRGRKAVYYATACLMAAAAIVVALLILILNKVVLGPLARVTRHAVTVGENADLTTPMDFNRADEIGVLARELDRMVARLAESRSQLVDQSFQAGHAELAKGVLHNMGNAMTPISVRLGSLQKRLRAIESADFQLVAEEISHTELDPIRRADLAELLKLASASLAETLRTAGEDLDVIGRQTSIIQSALAEQMRFAHNEQVWESVRGPDLLSQALEVVPEVALRNVRVEVDESLISIGVVYVPRTLLRLVLQNLIINAAEAIRAAGREQGWLRVSAQLREAGAGSHLILHCADDGIGIATELLTRIFEKGFSTKSRVTNQGIGLHWCANSLSALGGSVWATSEGSGRGSCLHVLLPLKSAAANAAAKAA